MRPMPELRWNLLEEVLQIESGVRATTAARLPECDVSPEFLLIELMAQTAGLAFGARFHFESDIVFAKLEQASFRCVPAAGIPLHVESLAEEPREEGCWFQSKVLLEDDTAASARLLLLNVGRLQPAAGRSVTFDERFMAHYRIREKISQAGGLPA